MNKPQPMTDNPADLESVKLLDQLLNDGELGTVQTIPIDGDLIVSSSIEKPFMEVWVIMPDGFRLGASLVMTPEQFFCAGPSPDFESYNKHQFYREFIFPVLEQLRAEYKSRMNK